MREDLQDLVRGVQWSIGRGLALKQAAQEFCREQVRVSVELGTDGLKAVHVELLAELPDGWKREAGTALNELRSLLDQLTNILARRAGANEDASSYPVLADASKINAQARTKVRQLSAADQQEIWDLQPFSNHWTQALAHLHHADIFRKHKNPLGLSTRTAGLEIGGHGSIGYVKSYGRGLLTSPGDRVHVGSFTQVGRDIQLGVPIDLTLVEPAEYRGAVVDDFITRAGFAVRNAIDRFDR